MSTTRIRIDPNDPQSWPEGSVDYDMLDRTTEEDVARHQREDEAEATMDAARYARRVRKRLVLQLYCIDGYRDFSLIRASAVVNLQLTDAPLRLR